MPQKINIRGVYFDNVTKDEAFERVKELIRDDSKVSVMYTPNSEIVQCCIDDESMYSVINSADLIIPDGIGVVYASKILGTQASKRRILSPNTQARPETAYLSSAEARQRLKDRALRDLPRISSAKNIRDW